MSSLTKILTPLKEIFYGQHDTTTVGDSVGISQPNLAHGMLLPAAAQNQYLNIANIAPHQHGFSASSLLAQTHHFRRYYGIYGCLLNGALEYVLANHGTMMFIQTDRDDGIDVEMELMLSRGGESMYIDFATLVDMVTHDRIEDMYRYLDVTMAMLPDAKPDPQTGAERYMQAAQQVWGTGQVTTHTHAAGTTDWHSLYGGIVG